MTSFFLSFARVSFRYPGSPHDILTAVSFDLPRGWTGVVGANGAGKTTLLLLAAGLLPPTEGSLRKPTSALYCPQRTDDPPDRFTDLLEAGDAAGGELRSRLEIKPDWEDRWETLSHGERKRAQIAVALWREPDVLCIDEPTNHVDAATRRLLVEGMRAFRGIGLLVSHDRQLLDLLCERCLMLEPGRLTLRPGTYSEASALDRADKDRQRELFDRAREAERGLSRTIAEKRREAAESRRRLSKRGIPRGDQDAKSRIDMARLTSKDRTSARLVREMEGRRSRVRDSLSDMDVRKEYQLGLWFASERARRDTLFAFDAATVPLGGDRYLALSGLEMRPLDRIALAGPNGSGKSTLLRWLIPRIPLAASRLIYMPQELGIEQGLEIVKELKGLPDEQRGRVLTIVNLLGSDPKMVLASGSLSPGELRKVMLAIGISRVPHLIIMDEPTNHLDLPSIECLTEALSECACGLLLASHDERFLTDLSTRRWQIMPLKNGSSELKEL